MRIIGAGGVVGVAAGDGGLAKREAM